MQFVPTTNMLLAKRSQQARLGSAAIEWAVGQLLEGRDTPHLRRLAGFTGRENPFELEDLFDRTLAELGIRMPGRDEAMLLYAQELAREFEAGTIGLDELLLEVCRLYHESGCPRQLYPFFVLRWTFDDLKERGHSYHLPDVIPENFNEILRTEIATLMAVGRYESVSGGAAKRYSP